MSPSPRYQPPHNEGRDLGRCAGHCAVSARVDPAQVSNVASLNDHLDGLIVVRVVIFPHQTSSNCEVRAFGVPAAADFLEGILSVGFTDDLYEVVGGFTLALFIIVDPPNLPNVVAASVTARSLFADRAAAAGADAPDDREPIIAERDGRLARRRDQRIGRARFLPLQSPEFGHPVTALPYCRGLHAKQVIK